VTDPSITEDQEPQFGRARERAEANARKKAKLAWSQGSFDLLASGYSPEQIAEVRKVSVRTIRREIDSAIARRQLDAPERYVHLQVARVTKALRFCGCRARARRLENREGARVSCCSDGSLSRVGQSSQ
jgi:DNA-binding NarL/FixJ family response regulator